MRAHDVVRVAVALDVRRVRRDLHPRAIGCLLFVREGVGAERLDAELLELHRDDVRDAVLQRRRGRLGAVVADRGDADRAVVPPVGVASDDVVAAGSTGPDVAELVDQVVVANVAPAARDGVEVIDGADRRGDVAAAVIGDGVVDDRLLHALVLGHPLHEGLVGAPVLPREDLLRAGGRGVRVAVPHVGERAGDVVHELRDRAGVHVGHVHERERHPAEGVRVAAGEPGAVLRVARDRERERPRELLVGVDVAHVFVVRQRGPVGPRGAILRDAHLDVDRLLRTGRGDPVRADAVEELPGVDDLRGEKERVAAGCALVAAGGERARPRERAELARGGPGLHDLVRDDQPGRAGGRDRGPTEIREQGE